MMDFDDFGGAVSTKPYPKLKKPLPSFLRWARGWLGSC
jgi:hypothetical protein